MNVVLDAGALIGIDRADRRVAGLIELARRAGANLTTAAPVVGQAWRGGGRAARLLPMIMVQSTGVREARSAGELLTSSGTSDVVDALLALAAVPGDQMLTSDPDDLRRLIEHRDIQVTVVRV